MDRIDRLHAAIDKLEEVVNDLAEAGMLDQVSMGYPIAKLDQQRITNRQLFGMIMADLEGSRVLMEDLDREDRQEEEREEQEWRTRHRSSNRTFRPLWPGHGPGEPRDAEEFHNWRF